MIGEAISAFLASHGYLAVALLVGLESIGIPLPGETALIAASVLAGASGKLDIGWVIASAVAGAVIGDTIGYWVGRTAGIPLLKRYGARVGLTEPRLKVGRYLFMRHGGKVVFFGRFVSLLRTLAAVMAGANRMPWPEFVLFNATGGILWACIYGFGAYYAGQAIDRISGPVGWALFAIGVLAIVGAGLFLRKHEQSLIDAAEKALPGPLE